MTYDREYYNRLLLERLSIYLNDYADFITPEMIEDVTASGALDSEEGFVALLAGALNIYDDKIMMNDFLRPSVRRLRTSDYEQNPYYRAVQFSADSEPWSSEAGEAYLSCGAAASNKALKMQDGDWQLTMKKYKPYEAFTCGDLRVTEDRRLLPQIGFFEEEYDYPCVLQDGREWMMITPNEIETMKEPIKAATGRVVTYGLGLGYFAFMAALKPDVKSVTVIELDPAVIRLFQKYVLPKFSKLQQEKIQIVQANAFEWAEHLTKDDADFVFADTWHDPSDGVFMYGMFKSMEKPGITYRYWIEDTLKYYL